MMPHALSRQNIVASVAFASALAMLIIALFVFTQVLPASVAKSASTTTYSESWTVTGGVYSGAQGYSNTTVLTYKSGIPSGDQCGIQSAYAGQYIPTSSSCMFEPTRWTVTGTINNP